jgi:RimJ/RimL family protein N-acetyltransferase
VTEGSLDRVETARLVCARTTADHLEDLATLLQDPAVAKTLTATGAPASDAEVRANVEAKVEHWNKYGFGFWMVYDRATGAFVGRGGLQHTLAAGGNDVEIGWASGGEKGSRPSSRWRRSTPVSGRSGSTS